MKLLSWNVNGLRAVLKKDFLPFVDTEDPDILCLQEIKAEWEQVGKILPKYEHQYWNSAQKKGYSGTAIFSKIKPLSVNYGLGIEEHDMEGRVIALEFDTFFVITVYTPNSGEELKRLHYRQKWDIEFLKYIQRLDLKKPVIVCGDLNVAHTPLDLAHPDSNYNVSAGYTQAEIDGLERYFQYGLVDSFRVFNKDAKHYSYWTYRFNCRQKNVGWRIDYFLVSAKLKEKLEEAFILSKVMGSDHCPVGIILNN